MSIAPVYGDRRRTFANVVGLGTESTSIAIDSLGTIDWCFFGDAWPSNLPYNVGSSAPSRQRDGSGDLYRGSLWQYGNPAGSLSVFNQNTGRFFTASAANNAVGSALNSQNAAGCFGTGAINSGPTFTLPAHRQKRRLTIYMTPFDASITCRARIINSELNDGKDLIEATEKTTSTVFYQSWIVDFASQIGGYLYVEVLLSSAISTNCHIKIQAATLAVAP